MNELKYNISEDGIKKLLKVRIKNDKEIKKSFRKLYMAAAILIVMLIVPITIVLKFDFKLSLIFIIGAILFYALLYPAGVKIKNTIAINKYIRGKREELIRMIMSYFKTN